MTPEFLLSAGRDLALLVVGSLLTLFGAWLSNRATAKREREAQATRTAATTADRNRATVERVRGLMFDLYLEGRAWEEAGETDVLRFDERTFRDAELSTELIADKQLRSYMEQVMLIAHNPQRSKLGERGAYAGTYTRVTAMRIAVGILSAHLRGDAIDPDSERFLRTQVKFALQRAKKPKREDETP